LVRKRRSAKNRHQADLGFLEGDQQLEALNDVVGVREGQLLRREVGLVLACNERHDSETFTFFVVRWQFIEQQYLE
jgi:hypothetical protein